MNPNLIFVRNLTRGNKHDSLVQQAELTHANTAYAKVQYSDGRVVTVRLEDLAVGPRNIVNETRLNDGNANRSPNQADIKSTLDNAVITEPRATKSQTT